jgi:ubiquinone/menaquinone biosynthesis C-methylase UbiE
MPSRKQPQAASRVKTARADGPRAEANRGAGPRTDWDDVSQWYDQHVGDEGSEYHRQVVLPGSLKLLEPAAGQAIIDIACGQGVLCRKLHELKIEVTGIDASEQLISAARERSNSAIHYRVADARDLAFLPPDRFDAAACLLAIQNIHPIQPIFESVARVLKPFGRFVIAMMHPVFRGSKETSWGWDEGRNVQYRRVDRYLAPRKSPIVTHPGKDPHQYTWSFHKPIEAYVKALRKAGLMIDAIEEWPSHKVSDSGPRAPAENLARKEIPLFMAIRARKMIELEFPPAGSSKPSTTGEP